MHYEHWQKRVTVQGNYEYSEGHTEMDERLPISV
jgi:hypothetical protein